MIFEKYHDSSEPIHSPYVNKGKRNIVNICISIRINFMQFKNQTENKDAFLTLKILKVHNTQYTEVFALLVTNTGNNFEGLQRKSYYEDQNNRRLERILLPNEAWTTCTSHAVPTLDRAIKEQHAN